MIEEIKNQFEKDHRNKISQKYDEKVEQLNENIQRYAKDNKKSFIDLIWEDTQYHEGYLRNIHKEIIDTE